MWWFEKRAFGRGYQAVAGIDEAGRGPLAGPVVSAAVILPYPSSTEGIDDSKKLTPKRREILYEAISENAVTIGVGIVSPSEIDRLNILKASLLSMALAVADLEAEPDYLLIDGNHEISSALPQESIIKGDSRSCSIAAASIVAKVTRDRLMLKYHDVYPQFGFDTHKGYPTRAHLKALQEHGPCPIHRRSFRGVRELSRV